MELDRKKMLTIATCEQAYVGQIGWFGNSIEELEASMKNKPVELKNILAGGADYPFFDGEYRHLYFYPAQESSYEERQAKWVKENDVKVGTRVRFAKNDKQDEDGSICSEHIGAERETGTVINIASRFIRVSVDGGDYYAMSVPYTILDVIKEPVKYRPFNEAELNQLVGKVVVKKSTGKRRVITQAFNTTVSSGFGFYIDARDLLDYYTFDDGTPCGKEEKQ